MLWRKVRSVCIENFVSLCCQIEKLLAIEVLFFYPSNYGIDCSLLKNISAAALVITCGNNLGLQSNGEPQ